MYKKLPMLQEGWDGDYHDSGSNKTPQDEIIRSPIGREQLVALAREAGCLYGEVGQLPIWNVTQTNLERFSALVVAHERELCAKVCDEEAASWTRLNAQDEEGYGAAQCAAAIRARGDK